MSWVVTLIKMGDLSGARNVETFGPYETHADAHRARFRIHNNRIYGKGWGRRYDQVLISELKAEEL